MKCQRVVVNGQAAHKKLHGRARLKIDIPAALKPGVMQIQEFYAAIDQIMPLAGNDMLNPTVTSNGLDRVIGSSSIYFVRTFL